jgi:HSP20 family protein
LFSVVSYGAAGGTVTDGPAVMQSGTVTIVIRGETTMALPTRVNRSQTIDPFEAMQREFDSMFGRYLTSHGGGNGARLAPYGVDVSEDADHIYVEAELPGFRKDDVDITLENQTLTISAERKSQSDPGKENKGELLLNERRYARFLRSFTLPPTVDEQSVNAKLADGVLTITLNKREESKPRKISVS